VVDPGAPAEVHPRAGHTRPQQPRQGGHVAALGAGRGAAASAQRACTHDRPALAQQTSSPFMLSGIGMTVVSNTRQQHCACPHSSSTDLPIDTHFLSRAHTLSPTNTQPPPPLTAGPSVTTTFVPHPARSSCVAAGRTTSSISTSRNTWALALPYCLPHSRHRRGGGWLRRHCWQRHSKWGPSVAAQQTGCGHVANIGMGDRQEHPTHWVLLNAKGRLSQSGRAVLAAAGQKLSTHLSGMAAARSELVQLV
jgi:hypothetical protein